MRVGECGAIRDVLLRHGLGIGVAGGEEGIGLDWVGVEVRYTFAVHTKCSVESVMGERGGDAGRMWVIVN